MSVRTFRAITALSLITLVFSVVVWHATNLAQHTQQRGISLTFSLPVRGAEQLLIGVNVPLHQLDFATRNARLDQLHNAGVRYVRQEFRWADIEKQPGVFDWSVPDQIFAALQQRNMQVLPVLLGTPVWAQPPNTNPNTITTPPQSEADFARFAQVFAQRYDPPSPQPSLILAYQIWDEPNLSSGWGNNLINPSAYLKILLAAGDAIRSVNPNVRIVLAGLAPTVETSDVNLAPHEYLRRLYQLGAHDAFDIAALKPFGFSAAPNDRQTDANVLNFSLAVLMHDVMLAHGDDQKAIWATQFGWNALPQGWQGKPSIWGSVSETQQADYTEQAIRRAASEWHWLGGMFVESAQPICADVCATDARWGFALFTQDGRARPVLAALTQAIRKNANAPRANYFSVCNVSPRVIAHAIDPNKVALGKRIEAINAIPNLRAKCYVPNPLAQFSPGWQFSDLGADMPNDPNASVKITFTGDALALIVRRAGREYRAYSYVSVDGAPANALPQDSRGAYLIMNSADYTPRTEIIPVATNLGAGTHTAEIKMDGGQNLWGLVGWSSKQTFSDFGFQATRGLSALLGLLGLMGLLGALPRGHWQAGWAHLRMRVAQLGFAHAAALALVAWVAAALTWAQDAVTAYRALTVLPLSLSALASAAAFWSPLYVLSLVALAVLFALVLLRLDLGLMLAACFIPFYLLPQKVWAYSFSMLELLVIMCAASWLLQKLETRNWHINLHSPFSILHSISLLDFAVASLVLIALLSASQAAFKIESFREWRVVILESALWYGLLRTSPLDQNQRARILDGFIIGAIGVASYGLFNYVRGDRFLAESGLPRIKSVFGSPNNDALFLMRAFAVALAGALHFKQHIHRPKLYALSLVPITLAILLSQSRGALLLGMPAVLATVCWLAGKRGRWVSMGIVALVVLAFAVLLSGAAAPLLQGTRWAHALDLQRGTGFFRINLWQSAWRMWQDHVWLGVGPDNFLYAYRSFYMLPAAWQEPNLSHPHNAILDFFTRLGVFGFLAGVGLVVGLTQHIRRSLAHPTHKTLAIAAAGVLAETLAHGMVDHSFFLVDLAFAFMLVAGLLAGGAEATKKT